MDPALDAAPAASLAAKYYYTFWRPETAVLGLAPFVPTPCFPSYPSAHAQRKLCRGRNRAQDLCRRGHWIELTSPSSVGVTLTYKSFKAITRDIDDARVHGGIHFRFDPEAAAVQRRDIGTDVYKNMLRPVRS